MQADISSFIRKTTLTVSNARNISSSFFRLWSFNICQGFRQNIIVFFHSFNDAV